MLDAKTRDAVRDIRNAAQDALKRLPMALRHQVSSVKVSDMVAPTDIYNLMISAECNLITLIAGCNEVLAKHGLDDQAG